MRVFPAVSKDWADVSFESLRAQGGFKVSAVREGGQTASVTVTATVDQELRLKNPFGGREFEANVPYKITGNEIRCTLKAGQTIKLEAGQ